jgi:hypothetical protein
MRGGPPVHQESPAPEQAAPDASGPGGDAGTILRLQQTVGNAAVARMLSDRSAGAVAAAGIRAPAVPFPHRETIQAAFGEHDVSGIRAHVGEQARASGRALGAEAYATGEDVVFAAPPDLETAAHEAAHVVQQRRGTGAPGAAPDPHEQAAEAVGRRVAAGGAVETLLAAGPATAKPPPVQLREVKTKTGTLDTSKLTRATIYELVLELSASGDEDDARAADELFRALHEEDFDIESTEDPDYLPSEDEEPGSDDEPWLGEKDLALPTEAYARYEQIHKEEEANPSAAKKKKKRQRSRGPVTFDRSKLAQNATAVAVYGERNPPVPERNAPPESTGEEEAPPDVHEGPEIHGAFVAQRSYPGMPQLATENLLELQIAPSALGNIHAEMLALHRSMEALAHEGIADELLEIHPSIPVCFFCEVMLRLFDVRYREKFVSKKLFPKWKDPSGLVQTPGEGKKRSKGEHGEKKPKRRYFTPRQMLELSGMSVEGAVARALPLFADLKPEDAQTLIQRILDGGLQGKELRRMIGDLKRGSALLAAANERRKKKAPAEEADAEEESEDLEEADPTEIEGVGVLVNVGSRDNNCLIEAILTAIGMFDERLVEEVRAHLVEQRAAARGEMLDLAGLQGALILSYLQHRGLLPASRGVVVHFWTRGVLGSASVQAGADRIHLWLSHNHFQAILPGNG